MESVNNITSEVALPGSSIVWCGWKSAPKSSFNYRFVSSTTTWPPLDHEVSINKPRELNLNMRESRMRMGMHIFNEAVGAVVMSKCRHLSEDSGISSCGSSVSSDVESVAAVLAAGAASDSEGSDSSDIEEDVDDVFMDDTSRSCGTPVEFPLQIRGYLRRVVVGMNRRLHYQEHRQVKALHLGRDFLDLGNNLRDSFPCRAAILPAMSLPMFLDNRSQYHRLGKFGTTETFDMIKCVRGCGFCFPVPTPQCG